MERENDVQLEFGVHIVWNRFRTSINTNVILLNAYQTLPNTDVWPD